MKISVEKITFQSDGNTIIGRLYRPEKRDARAPGIIIFIKTYLIA